MVYDVIEFVDFDQRRQRVFSFEMTKLEFTGEKLTDNDIEKIESVQNCGQKLLDINYQSGRISFTKNDALETFIQAKTSKVAPLKAPSLTSMDVDENEEPGKNNLEKTTAQNFDVPEKEIDFTKYLKPRKRRGSKKFESLVQIFEKKIASNKPFDRSKSNDLIMKRRDIKSGNRGSLKFDRSIEKKERTTG